jgi:hypothetical protein
MYIGASTGGFFRGLSQVFPLHWGNSDSIPSPSLIIICLFCNSAQKETGLVFEDKEHTGNIVGNKIQAFWNSLEYTLTERRTAFRTSMMVGLGLAYNAYFIAGELCCLLNGIIPRD